MNQQQIQKALAFWKTTLKLEDWNITAKTAKAKDLDNGNCEGLNYICPEELKSEILLRRGASEEVLVHEILHICLQGDEPQEGHYDVLIERAINRIASALMSLKK